MIFTSYTYVLFLSLAFLIHWSIPVSWRKGFLILASYVFYCSWKWEYGFLLLGVSLFNWAYAKYVLTRHDSMRALLLGIAINVGALVYFKYTGFLLDNVTSLARLLGLNWQSPELRILLPLGISFFTFQGVAYLFDVASGEEPLHNLVDFLLFKALWPQLIAGPIVRLSEMRDQLATPRQLNYDNVAEGSRRILFGFFKKVVLADALASHVELIFGSRVIPGMTDCITGMVGFGMQIYFDFSAYSDIAIGTARLFGFKFPENFNWPYISRSPREFWDRWHMSLSRWIRDYIFMPLSFASRNRPHLAPLWLLVAMALCGLWHGAAWTFIVWGIWHGLLLALNQTVLKKFFPRREGEGERQNALHILLGAGLTFLLVSVGWLFFRAASMAQALAMLKSILTFNGGLRPTVIRENGVLTVAAFFVGMMLLQLARHWVDQPLQRPRLLHLGARLLKPAAYAIMIIAIVVFDQEARTFVYFQF